MNISINTLFKNIRYTVIVNIFLLVISIILTIFIPNFLSIVEFGLWQLYKFYQTYLGYLHLGWSDGIFLNLGGEEYKKINFKLYFSQFLIYLFMQITVAIIFFVALYYTSPSIDKKLIISVVSIMIVLLNTRTFFAYILLSTNRISEYNQISLIERGLFIVIIFSFYLLKMADYKLIILADVFCVFISFVYSIYLCKEVVFQKIENFYFCFKEIFQNISSGSKLLFANITSMLIIGVVRISIENGWGITVFGKISLIINLVGIVMIFINSISNILFPTIRKIPSDKISNIYLPLKAVITAILFGIFIIYVPLKELFSYFLPKYSESITYLVLVFPILVYECKMGLITNPILKSLRLEGKLFKLNIFALLLSIVLAMLSISIFKNLTLTVSIILIILIIRSTIAEIILCKLFVSKYLISLLEESLLVLVFIFSNWYLSNTFSFLTYVVAYLIYMLINRAHILLSFKKIVSFF